MFRTLTTIILIWLFVISASAQNSCGTKASFTPNSDTTLYAGQAISFINTSQHADSYEWFNDVINRTTTTDFINFNPAVGVTQIMLVAHRGTCSDTTLTYVVNNGTPPADQKRMITSYGLPVSNEWANGITKAKTDGYLLACVSDPGGSSGYTSPYFIRVSETGCILWSKMLPLDYQSNVNSVISTYDSGFVAKVEAQGFDESQFMIKFDKNGNIMWVRRSEFLLSQGNTLREMSDHSLMILDEGGPDFTATSLDEQGYLRWQKYYVTGGQGASPVDVVEQNGSAWVVGNYTLWNNNLNIILAQHPMIFKIDLATGNLVWSQAYTSTYKDFYFHGIHFYKDGLIINGVVDTVDVSSGKWLLYETLLETDLDGNIRDGKLIYSPGEHTGSTSNDNLFVHPDQSISLINSLWEYRTAPQNFVVWTNFLRLDKDKNILWQNQYTGFGNGIQSQAAPAPAKGLAIIGDRMNNLLNPSYGFSNNVILVKVDSNGNGPDQHCDFYKTFFTIQPMTVTPDRTRIVAVHENTFVTKDHPIVLIYANTELRYNCPDYLPLCSFMKLSGKSFVCNLKDTIEFIAHKDPSCADPVKWTYDVSNIKTVYEDGAKTRLLFKTGGTYKIKAEKAFPCSAITDSIMVTVAPAPPHVDFGGDTVLCKGQSLTLQPQGTLGQYLWQDGSQTESFLVVDTGFYRLQVFDQHQCSAADSIHITDFAEAPQQFLPADTIVCSYLGGLIVPKGDFRQYSWSTGETEKSIKVKTAGEYILNIVDQRGCRGSDSINVAMKECEALLVFPNAFSPNHDGLNDVFRLKYPGHAADYNLQIFNRWGQKIFETTDTSAGWDGTFNSQHQPEGNYIWIVRYTDNNGKKQNLQGSVVLVR